MSKRAVSHLYEELQRMIDWHVQEYHLSCAEVIGVLYMVLADCMKEVQEYDGGKA